MSTIKTKLLLINSLSDEEGTFIAHVEFPMSPVGPFPLNLGGAAYVPILGCWEIDVADGVGTPVLVLRVMTKENADAVARAAEVTRSAGALRPGASGMVLDLNAIRRS